MVTTFDIGSLPIFAMIAVVYLHRSAKEEKDVRPLWSYALVATACAAGDVIGNRGYVVGGAVMLLAAFVGVVWIARPEGAPPGERK